MSQTETRPLHAHMISFQSVEDLKSELTGKYVVVRPGFAELKRFEKLSGVVKTVNMNGRALVEFDGPVDIGWYDIDPACLNVVDSPRPKAQKSEKPAEAAKPATEKPKPATGKSPLEMARGGAVAAPAADAGKKPSPLDLARGAAKPAAAAPATGEKKLSPLELARQGASGGAVKPAAAPAPAAGDKKGSPLDQIRAEGAAKPAAAPEASAAPVETQAVVEAPAVQAEAPAAPAAGKTARAADPPGASKLELAREPLRK